LNILKNLYLVRYGSGDANEVLNSRAVEVMKRMSDKLLGRDFPLEGSLNGLSQENDTIASQVIF
jgi:FKBP12-rapamycin complex-associated protein